jgi:cytochrome P450
LIGPIIRVNPNELHFNDAYFYNTIYSGSKHRRDKDANHAAMSGVKYATNVTVDHDLHRQRRGYIAGFFGKQTILRLEPLVQQKVDKLVQKLRDAHWNGETVSSMNAFVATTADVITHYAYGESFGELDKADLSCPLANG